MKVIKSLALVAGLATMVSCNNQKADVKSLETEIDSASYALGMDMAIKIKSNFSEADTDMFLQGYRNGMDSTNMLMKEEELGDFLRTFFQKQQMEKAQNEAKVKFAAVKAAGEKFLAENKTKEGVVTTDSGLQYMVLKEGKGDVIDPTNKVKLHYHGTTIDGQVFDSTVDRNEPYETVANIFIPGFNEGLAMMKVGSKYKFFIPQELAYGAQQRGQLIKPFSALIFEVEILEILED
ncbi:FKBP-type peptidyl-prolyl cis-trans isomerase [Polaribacter dokdonensis]|uniref:Peptidyl-prolyl cis-trans isomerase n=1 Tax=Polaribacter dokdonensis DSW-5 TaxID=1300348 RepID=A0A0M9CH20_9FLAO|nr:FKBP-type peptidyl-prolyl cis-trans isomerase [Polaribacter dokdonensis]KOY52491.1 Peptidyl-prolyl cis-trans isomerase [Polaribacter dokdonensis DSW-5]SEE46540.1 FKBP-type peptidyl-prolyl cis-trans isomerase FklB [Polaribacter dokdonensis DSW-5]